MQISFKPDEMRKRVEAALPYHGGVKPRDIFQKHPEMIPKAVRFALLELVRSGQAMVEGEIGHRLYSRNRSPETT